MLEKGITRDMFLVACNKKYNRIRHLVISGFLLLGRVDEKDLVLDSNPRLTDFSEYDYLEKIKAQAIYKFH
jgi:hypothetical protein